MRLSGEDQTTDLGDNAGPISQGGRGDPVRRGQGAPSMQGVLHLCQQRARLIHSLQGALGFGLGFAAPFGSFTW